MGIHGVLLREGTDSGEDRAMKGVAAGMRALNEVEVRFRSATAGAVRRFSRLAAMKNGTGGQDAMNEFEDEVKVGGVRSAQLAKHGPVHSGGNSVRPVLGCGNMPTKGLVKIEMTNGGSQAVGDVLVKDGEAADRSRKDR